MILKGWETCVNKANFTGGLYNLFKMFQLILRTLTSHLQLILQYSYTSLNHLTPLVFLFLGLNKWIFIVKKNHGSLTICLYKHICLRKWSIGSRRPLHKSPMWNLQSGCFSSSLHLVICHAVPSFKLCFISLLSVSIS